MSHWVTNVVVEPAPGGAIGKTYVGIFDAIRQLFAETPESRRRGYSASQFSFNVKGGRCETCAGRGAITTSLMFMPEVEVLWAELKEAS